MTDYRRAWIDQVAPIIAKEYPNYTTEQMEDVLKNYLPCYDCRIKKGRLFYPIKEEYKVFHTLQSLWEKDGFESWFSEFKQYCCLLPDRLPNHIEKFQFLEQKVALFDCFESDNPFLQSFIEKYNALKKQILDIGLSLFDGNKEACRKAIEFPYMNQAENMFTSKAHYLDYIQRNKPLYLFGTGIGFSNDSLIYTRLGYKGQYSKYLIGGEVRTSYKRKEIKGFTTNVFRPCFESYWF